MITLSLTIVVISGWTVTVAFAFAIASLFDKSSVTHSLWWEGLGLSELPWAVAIDGVIPEVALVEVPALGPFVTVLLVVAIPMVITTAGTGLGLNEVVATLTTLTTLWRWGGLAEEAGLH